MPRLRLVEVDVPLSELERHQHTILQRIHPHHTIMDFNIGSVLWFGSRAQGSMCVPPRAALESDELRYGPVVAVGADGRDAMLAAAAAKKQRDRARNEAHRLRVKEEVLVVVLSVSIGWRG
jgi:hypothetical protein